MGYPGVPWNEKQRAAGKRRTDGSLRNKVKWAFLNMEKARADLVELGDRVSSAMPDEDDLISALRHAEGSAADATAYLEPFAGGAA